MSGEDQAGRETLERRVWVASFFAKILAGFVLISLGYFWAHRTFAIFAVIAGLILLVATFKSFASTTTRADLALILVVVGAAVLVGYRLASLEAQNEPELHLLRNGKVELFIPMEDLRLPVVWREHPKVGKGWWIISDGWWTEYTTGIGGSVLPAEAVE